MADVELVEVLRGDRVECVHRGHAVVVDGTGRVVESWGDPAFVTYPRSSAKMIQALPLVESGAADAAGLKTEHLALACASHHTAPRHVALVEGWMEAQGFTDSDYRCGPHLPLGEAHRHEMIREGVTPCRHHNQCSGKHSGFLTLNRRLGAGAEYCEIDHPVQTAVRDAWQEACGEPVSGWGIDGCSAPNFATSLEGAARAMAAFATAGGRSGARARAMVRLHEAMRLHPELVSDDGTTCTELMRATGGKLAIKGGADGFYVAIWPERGLGVALKISDGAERAKGVAIAALLRRLGALPDTPEIAARFIEPVQRNYAGLETGVIRPASALG